MKNSIQYGKISTTKNIVDGEIVFPIKEYTEESIEVASRADQDVEYIKFADEEELLQKSGRLIDAEFQIKHTSASDKRGTYYAIKKFTVLDSGS